jgi:hypothetical protein
MPTPSEPIPSEEGSRFGVDSCAPQFAAMRVGRIRLCALTKDHFPYRVTFSCFLCCTSRGGIRRLKNHE